MRRTLVEATGKKREGEVDIIDAVLLGFIYHRKYMSDLHEK